MTGPISRPLPQPTTRVTTPADTAAVDTASIDVKKTETPAPLAPAVDAPLVEARVLDPVVVEQTREGVRAEADTMRAAWLAKTGLPAQASSSSTTSANTVTAPTTAALPPGAHDVATTTKDEIAAMKKSRDPNVKLMGATIERAQKSYATQLAAGARIIASAPKGNGGAPVLTMTAPGFDPTKPARVHTHYHGFSSTVAPPKGHGTGFNSRLDDIWAKDPQTVFVLPEAKNASAGSYKTDWSNVSNQRTTTNDALSAAGVANVGTRVVSAHSGGGTALSRAMQSNKDGSGVEADRLELHDNFYGSEHAIAAWAKTPAGSVVKDVHYYRGTNDMEEHSDKGVARAFGDRYTRHDVKALKVAPVLVDEQGNETKTPRFSRDAHNRTVAEYLGSEAGP
jgi:hypothetical protein